VLVPVEPRGVEPAGDVHELVALRGGVEGVGRRVGSRPLQRALERLVRRGVVEQII
jgi:hypothetical protein